MAAAESVRITSERLVEYLCDPKAYPHQSASGDVPGCVTVRETHISWVFLVGDYAYKVKKPIKTPFLDYTSLSRREHFCREEVRLDSRYAADLYLGVVPIVPSGNRLRVDHQGDPIEFAVKMRRFPDDALLSERLAQGAITTAEVTDLATTIADFHRTAQRLHQGQPWGSPASVLADATDNLRDLDEVASGQAAETLDVLRRWTFDFFEEHRPEFMLRVANGFIRECHGDLHLANIVCWQGRWVPFDGIEFNDQYRWIDVLSDAAFTAMDFAARRHLELCRSFVSMYMECAGDHASPSLLRWYLVYRALTRAKVAAIRAGQSAGESSERMQDCENFIKLADYFSVHQKPVVWITHGVSGSGKTTASEAIVQREGAIRLRSDIERKRHFGFSPTERSSSEAKDKLYSESASHATYARLRRIAIGILRAGYPVIIDAAFLKHRERSLFHDLANSEGASFGILDCDAEPQILRQRISDRLQRNDDASDADLSVLEHQLACREPLTEAEQAYVIHVSDSSRVNGEFSS